MDTLAFIPDTLGITIDMDLLDVWQLVNTDSDSVRLGTRFEHIIGSDFDDYFYFDPDTVARSIDDGKK